MSAGDKERRSGKPADVDAATNDVEQLDLPGRRNLAKLAVYAAPAIIGTLLISRDAMAQPVSCNPATCNPNGGPCGPQNCNPRP